MTLAGNSAARARASSAASNSEGSSVQDLPPFATVYKLYFAFVWSSVRRLGVRPEAIDDVVQEIFLTIHFRLETIEKPSSLRSWIYSVVRRTVSGYHRARKAKDVSNVDVRYFDDTLQSSQPTPLERTEQRDQQLLLAKLLNELDEVKREVFVLAELEEMTAPEIALALEIPLNTVYSRLRTARLAFEQALARHSTHEKGERP